jgi:HK97 family phage prohead protease
VELERRALPLPLNVETRDDGATLIRGMAAKYKTRSVDLGGFTEEILPGAFDAVMKREGRNIVSAWNHNMDMPLGSERSGTLRVFSTDDGLGYEVNPPATRADIVELIRRGDVYGSSFAFTIARDGEEWSKDENGNPLRFVSAVENLYELGPVLTPAYADTNVSVARRSLERFLQADKPALSLPHLKRNATLEKSIRRFLRQHGHKVG